MRFLTFGRIRTGIFTLFARAHRITLVATGLLTIPVTELVLGNLRVVLPGAEGSVTFRSLAPATIAALIVANSQTEMTDWEASAAQPKRNVTGYFLYGNVVLGGLVTYVTQLSFNNNSTAVVITRCYVMCISLALISGRMFGWRTAWILPLGSYFPLTYLQLDANRHSRWWDWPSQPMWDSSTWILTGITIASAICIVRLTPHQTVKLKNPWHRTNRSPKPHRLSPANSDVT